MNIPTAEEFLQNSNKTTFDAIEKTMIEFAKLHVQAALKAADDNSIMYISADSILNAYPLENIK